MLYWILTSILVTENKRTLYLSQFCTEILLEITFPNEFVGKHKHGIDVQKFIFWKLCRFWDNVKKMVQPETYNLY